ncbi:acyl-[acyl-carrier-protein] thioesterase [Rhodothermus marinus]|uniref:Acyl-ACP thioesterase n=1 Tax=Rhodothermus marinus (strain ATCC 43812 / DSM 4252 / R-10) TaxID=518766 RepID=D0MKK4_RHOM4|nr:acyl-ACP thioesterase domain-containing protein [Rhodothermus marinus]ACY48916.1 acyl-ACP thioesterase [Rhodothermus marinus DSM 4252]
MTTSLRWTETLRVRSFDVASDGLLSLPALAGYLQEAASRHATALEVAFLQVEGRPVFWVLHQLRLQLHRRPAWAETVHVDTWPCGHRGLRALRAYAVRDENGCLLAEGLSAWLLVDPVRRRPVRLPPEVLRLRGEATSPVPPETALPAVPEIPPRWSDTVRVRFSDLDRNGHANNTRYLAWLLDALPDTQRACSLQTLVITFRSEARLNDPVVVESWPLEPNRLRHRFTHSTDRQLLAEALTVWAASN